MKLTIIKDTRQNMKVEIDFDPCVGMNLKHDCPTTAALLQVWQLLSWEICERALEENNVDEVEFRTKGELNRISNKIRTNKAKEELIQQMLDLSCKMSLENELYSDS